VTHFSALLYTPDARNAGEDARHLNARIATALSNSQLNSWKLGDNLAPAKRRALIGVAPYSTYDLKLLDVLNELR
jgi:hypothetical protein